MKDIMKVLMKVIMSAILRLSMLGSCPYSHNCYFLSQRSSLMYISKQVELVYSPKRPLITFLEVTSFHLD